MGDVLRQKEIRRMIYNSNVGDILVIGKMSWYYDDDFALNGWVCFNTGTRYMGEDMVAKILRYRSTNPWWLY